MGRGTKAGLVFFIIILEILTSFTIVLLMRSI